MDTEKELLLEAFAHNKYHLNEIFESKDDTITRKSAKLSEESRDKGNELFKQKNRDAETHIDIFRYYCQSIAYAPLDSEVLAKAYANRSAFLLYMHKFDECIEDVDRALKITKSEMLKIMLLCRKVECMKKLGSPNYKSIFDEAENYAKMVGKSNEAQVNKLINKVKACPTGDRKVSRNQSDQNENSPEVARVFDCVSIEHNDKYGRHLIAKKDYNPGDFIFRDDLYATLLNPRLKYTNCNYCLKICWAGVQCDDCSWAMFCSEDCKKKAWDAFHDVECFVIPHLEKAHLMYFEPIEMALRLLLIGIRESGSIDKLKEDLEVVDRCTNTRNKGFDQNGQSTNSTIQSMYSLKSREIFKMIPDLLAMDALLALTFVAKHGKLIENIEIDQIDDIVTNESLVFLGLLLIKFALISVNNNYSFSQMNCDCQRLKRTDGKCCDRGKGLSTLASLLNHSCTPKAGIVFTEDRKINIFALQPIKKNSQIFVTYASFYYNKSPMDRERLLDGYNFTCECEACTESWPPLFLIPYDEAMAMQSPTEEKLHKICKNIFDALDVKQIDFDKSDVEKLCKTIVRANKSLTGPTFCMAALEDSLLLIYSRIYGWKSPMHVFGKCNNV